MKPRNPAKEAVKRKRRYAFLNQRLRLYWNSYVIARAKHNHSQKQSDRDKVNDILKDKCAIVKAIVRIQNQKDTQKA
jgi:hypothetical protein